MMPQVCLLTKEQAADHWDQIEWRIDSTPELSRWYSKDDIIDKIFKDEMQIWTAGSDLVLLTQVVTAPSGKVLQIVWAHGSGLNEHWDELREKFNTFAWMAGAQRLEVLGRPGWARRFQREKGFRVDYVAYGADVIKPRMN